MIAGIGTDMVEIARMVDLLARHPDGPARHILAPEELADWQAAGDPARFLAKRFAVKEALSKALGTGLRDPVLLTAIRLEHDPAGKPTLAFSPKLSAYMAARGIVAHHVSISDERSYALAFVVLERLDAPTTREILP
ncbi:holo-ACP synthase [Paludibacterium purpuratum]|uniref:Holo-[acyl-carrier-protein] synthase n=1 Tax=Paludibacterium purpuratum TaxID=1144873 RepID=A0A4R7B5J6_9NEIS|nr:holo-ACP synthase [Paludibacterium purpuratum]TDR79871.1 holo-[acyl-carrier protein] synthase [Paludibacterium purpuratum]